MKNLAIINAAGLTSLAFRSLHGGSSSFERVLEYARSLPFVSDICILKGSGNNPDLPADDGKITLSDAPLGSASEFLTAVHSVSAGFDDIFYFYGDAPLLSSDITARMYDNHLKYFAEYSFADGYPYGLTPEIFRSSMTAPLSVLAEKVAGPLSRSSVFDVILKDINAFDVETELSPADLRQLRVSLTADTKRNFQGLEKILDAGGCDEESVIRVLNDKPEILRTLPKFFNIQVAEGCPQACSYCPYPKIAGDVCSLSGEMAPSDFAGLMKQIKDFADDAVVSASLWGDPSRHTRFDKIAGAVLDCSGLELLIETSGIGWNPDVLEKIFCLDTSRISWIISLDADDPDVYRKLRGDGQHEAVEFAGKLLAKYPEKVWVQAVRQKENEESLEGFYREWKKRTDNIIIQKYDYFSGSLPDSKVTDLSPVKRFPCWHLKRDFPVLLNGDVPVCREDIGQNHIMGNVFSDGIEKIWQKSVSFYNDHITGNYPEICRNCDEYYTYNF